ncbi:MAG TPA: hypothetical protein DHW50_06970 [Akkermansia sp.]|nr:hypothetical protein CXU18_04655 [Akkermansia muciniphila]HCL33385.1 hypothetical protein [Akkermansia sp.]
MKTRDGTSGPARAAPDPAVFFIKRNALGWRPPQEFAVISFIQTGLRLPLAARRKGPSSCVPAFPPFLY